MTILKDNLIHALRSAINTRRAYEKMELKYTQDSALVKGWEDVVNALEKGEKVTIKEN